MGAERLPMRQTARNSATEVRGGLRPPGHRPGLRGGRGDGVGVRAAGGGGRA